MVEKRCWTTNRIAAVEAAKGIAEKWRSDGKSGLPWEDEAADFHALADGFLELFNADPLKLIADLAAENSRYQRALEFYANPANNTGYETAVCSDEGDIARAALAKAAE